MKERQILVIFFLIDIKELTVNFDRSMMQGGRCKMFGRQLYLSARHQRVVYCFCSVQLDLPESLFMQRKDVIFGLAVPFYATSTCVVT